MPSDNLFAKMDAPLVLLEAMSQGVPLVLANVPPLDEILATGAGLPVPPADPEALAQSVIRLLGDDKLRETLGEAGQEAVRTVFSADVMAKQVEDVYDEVLSR
jgi:glycosyltransferase involved in cell wall biosynthesis